MSGSIRILSTKPLNESSQETLCAARIILTTQPFIQITLKEQLKFPQIKEANVIFTSVNAVNALIPFLNQLPHFKQIFCITGATEQLLKHTFGDKSQYIAKSYASELLEQIIEQHKSQNLWFFKGSKALPTIPNGLKDAEMDFETFEVYINTLSPFKMNQDFEGILFFSPSAVESFFQDNAITDNTITFAIGKTTAKALKGYANNIIISEIQSEVSVIQSVIKHFNL